MKMNNRIGMLVHACYLIDARVRRTAETLAAHGFEVHVVSAREPDKNKAKKEPKKEVVNGVTIHRVLISPKRGSKLRYVFEYVAMLFLGAIKLNTLSLFKKFNIIHIHNMPDLLVLSGLTLKWRKSSVILDIHDPMSELFQENYNLDSSSIFIKFLKIQEKFCYKLPDFLLTVSWPMGENIQKKIGEFNNGIRVIHNFPNQKSFPISTENRDWPYNKGKFVLLYCGTVTEHYRLDVAVKAVAEASKYIKNIEFKILGRGNRLDSTFKLAQQIGIGDKVEYLSPVPQNEVKGIMKNADIGISTHKNGVFGDLYFSTKILEFMTQGLPVITSRTFTIDNYIPEDSIFYFNPMDVEDLTNKIIFMYNNPKIVLEKIHNSKKLLGEYSWENESKKLIKLYKEIIVSN